MSYSTTQSSAKIHVTSVAIVFLVGTARVTFEYMSVMKTMNLLPVFVFGRGPSMLTATSSGGSPVEIISTDVDALAVEDVFDMRSISPGDY